MLKILFQQPVNAFDQVRQLFSHRLATEQVIGKSVVVLVIKAFLARCEVGFWWRKAQLVTPSEGQPDRMHHMRQGFPIAMPGVVIGAGMPRHRAKEVLNFLQQIDKALPARRDVHLVPDTCVTQKTPGVKAWLDKHPRCKRHCRPTGASWRTLVERFFDQITAWRIRGGRSSSVDNPEAAIHDCLAQHSGKPKPFNWT
jgi:hypothetical protein